MRRRCVGCGQFADPNHPAKCPSLRAKQSVPTAFSDLGKAAVLSQATGPSLPYQQMGAYSDLYRSFQSHVASPIEVSETVELVTADATRVQVEDYSPTAEHLSVVSLAQLSDPDKCGGGNCYSATVAINDHIASEVGVPEGWDTGSVELQFRNELTGDTGAHWAPMLVAEDGGEEWVMDYTARQFDPHAAFPLVARRSAWQAWVSDRIRVQYNMQLTQAALY